VVANYDGWETHVLTDAALSHLAPAVDWEWVSPGEVASLGDRVERFDGILIGSGIPSGGIDGTLAAIRFARERGVPLVGT